MYDLFQSVSPVFLIHFLFLLRLYLPIMVYDLINYMCRYRLNEEKAEVMVYVTDVGQSQHFDMVFKVTADNHYLH